MKIDDSKLKWISEEDLMYINFDISELHLANPIFQLFINGFAQKSLDYKKNSIEFVRIFSERFLNLVEKYVFSSSEKDPNDCVTSLTIINFELIVKSANFCKFLEMFRSYGCFLSIFNIFEKFEKEGDFCDDLLFDIVDKIMQLKNMGFKNESIKNMKWFFNGNTYEVAYDKETLTKHFTDFILYLLNLLKNEYERSLESLAEE